MSNIVPLVELKSVAQTKGNQMSELNQQNTLATEVPSRIARSEVNEDLKRWYSILKFCPPETFDSVQSRLDQPYQIALVQRRGERD